MDGCKIAKFVKVFSLESFPLYSTGHYISKLNIRYIHKDDHYTEALSEKWTLNSVPSSASIESIDCR